MSFSKKTVRNLLATQRHMKEAIMNIRLKAKKSIERIRQRPRTEKALRS